MRFKFIENKIHGFLQTMDWQMNIVFLPFWIRQDSKHEQLTNQVSSNLVHWWKYFHFFKEITGWERA